MKNIAPIGLSAYSRLSHLKRTIAALKNNFLADQSNLYVFSDAAKEGDAEKVYAVREFLHAVDGFKKIEIIERKKNNRVKNNREGIKYLLNEYGKIIFLEEDIVTAPNFLKFMNEALNYYENNEKVFSITGYTPPIRTEHICNNDIFVLPRFNAWGFGIWKYRYDSIKYFDKKDLKNLLKDQKINQYITRYLGEDISLMLQYEAEKKIDALDVKAIYQQILFKKYTIYPKKSLVSNIGFDGSGIHCPITDKFKTVLWQKDSFKFTNNLKLNDKIVNEHRYFRKLDRKTKYSLIARKYKFYDIYKYLKNILSSFGSNIK